MAGGPELLVAVPADTHIASVAGVEIDSPEGASDALLEAMASFGPPSKSNCRGTRLVPVDDGKYQGVVSREL